MRDPTEFRERFKRWKAGERVYDSGQTLPQDYTSDPVYKGFKSTLPDNLRLTPEESYSTHRYWELNGRPLDFSLAIQRGMYTLDRSDGHYHANSVARDENGDYEFMKPKTHSTVGLETQFYYTDKDFNSQYKLIDDPKRPGFYKYKSRGYSLPTYDDGKTPEETYYGQLLPTVTIEGHKPTFWENVGNWFVNASKRAAFNENPAVMTASGWTAYPDGSTKLDAFDTPERNKLADKLVDIGVYGATDVWGGPLASWAIGKVWNTVSPYLKFVKQVRQADAMANATDRGVHPLSTATKRLVGKNTYDATSLVESTAKRFFKQNTLDQGILLSALEYLRSKKDGLLTLKDALSQNPIYGDPNKFGSRLWEDLWMLYEDLGVSQEALAKEVFDYAKKYDMPAFKDIFFRPFQKRMLMMGDSYNPKTNSIQMSTTLNPKEYDYYLAHEYGHKHEFNLPRYLEKRKRLKVNKKAFDKLEESTKEYFNNHYLTELSQRLGQIKNYFGIVDDSPLTPGMLKYAKKHYTADTGVANNMQEFFDVLRYNNLTSKWTATRNFNCGRSPKVIKHL